MEKVVVNNRNKGIGIRGKTVMWLGFLLICALGATGGVTFMYGARISEETALSATQEKINDRVSEIEAFVEGARDDLFVMLDTPPVQAIVRSRDNKGVDPLSKDTIEEWLGRLEQIFYTFASNHGEYNQIRYLDEYGQELIRIERDSSSGKVSIVPVDLLQSKGGRSYVKDTLALGPGKVYYSKVDLNREDGGVQVPHTPIFRVSAPVYDEKGRPRGLIILNVLAREMFKGIRTAPEGVEIFLANKDGYFLSHPDPSKEFGFDLDLEYTVSDMGLEVYDRIADSDFLVEYHKNEGHVEGFNKVFFDPGDRSRYWTILYEIPDSMTALGSIYATRNSMVLNGIIIAVIAIIIITWVTSVMVLRPILVLSGAAEKLGEGDLSVRLDEESVTDEFRTLYSTVNSFAESQKGAVERFEAELSRRTEELESVNSRMQSFFDNAPDAIISITPGDKSITFFSKGAEKMFAYRAEEVLGENVNMLMPEPFRSAHDGYIDRYMSTRQGAALGMIRGLKAVRKGGEVLDIELALSRGGSGEDTVFNGVIRDVSEKLKADMEMQKLVNAIEQSAESVMITDGEGAIEYVNPAFEKITGYGRGEIIGSNPSVLKSGVHNKNFYANLWSTIKDGSIWKGEFTNKKKSGEIYYEECTITPVKNQEGDITNFISLKRDITEKKVAAEELEMKNVELKARASYEQSYSKIIEIFSSTNSKDEAFEKTLSLLAEEQKFLASAVYL